MLVGKFSLICMYWDLGFSLHNKSSASMSTLIPFTAPDAPSVPHNLFCQPSPCNRTLCLVLMVYLTVIADNLQSTDHLTHGEEPKNLCENDSICRPLLAVGASDLTEGLTRGSGNAASQRARVSDRICERLEV